MLSDRQVNINGSFVPWQQATVHMMSHSFGRGSAVFEVLGVHDTADGPAVFRLDAHIERLQTTVGLLGMALPLSAAELQQAVCETVKRNEVRSGFIKIMGYYPQFGFQILPPAEVLDVAVFVFDPQRDMGMPPLSCEGGTSLALSRWRKLDPKTVPVEAKVSANYLNGMVARMEAVGRGFDHAVMCDRDGFVAEGGTESIFMVSEGGLKTPALGGILQGITRRSILEAARQEGMTVEELPIRPQALATADEIFLAGTPFKVLPVHRYEDRRFETAPGAVTLKLQQLMDRIVRGEDPRYIQWLFAVH